MIQASTPLNQVNGQSTTAFGANGLEGPFILTLATSLKSKSQLKVECSNKQVPTIHKGVENYGIVDILKFHYKEKNILPSGSHEVTILFHGFLTIPRYQILSVDAVTDRIQKTMFTM